MIRRQENCRESKISNRTTRSSTSYHLARSGRRIVSKNYKNTPLVYLKRRRGGKTADKPCNFIVKDELSDTAIAVEWSSIEDFRIV